MRYASARYINLFLCFGFGLFIATTAYAQSIIYVNHAATGTNDGTSWSDAYTFLQDALQAAQSGDEVWVAQGVYRPDQGAGVVPGDREASFEIPGGVSVYGGFNGSELALDQRDWEAYETILSGDLLGNDDDLLSFDNPLRLDNSYRIVRIEHSIAPVALDGLTIRDGMAATEDGHASASGVRILGPSVDVFDFPFYRISNCLFTRNVALTGTIGISAQLNSVEPVVLIEDSIFERNFGNGTSGIEITSGTTLIQNVLFTDSESNRHTAIDVGHARVYVSGSTIRDNRMVSDGVVNVGGADEEDDSFLYIWDSIIAGNEGGCCGAGIRVKEAELISINNVITGNSVSYGGGAAIYAIESKVRLINNVIAFNSAPDGGAVESTISSVSISNSIFWQNTAAGHPDFYSARPDTSTITISHSIVEGPFPQYVVDQGGNLASDPLFQDADGIDNIPGTIDDDFQLLYWSPAVDAGINDSLFADFWDLDNDGDFDEFWPTDFYGDPRIIGIRPSSFPVVDLGPFEFNGPPPTAIEEDESPGGNGPSIIGVYPNPFASNTSITFTLDHPSEIRIEVYNILGKRVRVLEQGFRAAGEHEVRFDATTLPTGVYFIRLNAEGNTQTQEIVLFR